MQSYDVTKPLTSNTSQHTIKQQNPIFIYIRRSTKNKQDLSLERQEDSANETIEQTGYDIENIKFYSESISAYNGVKIKGGQVIRKRTQFQKMINDIDKSPVPVTLLTYEHSRLSRNDYDSQAIVDRLFHEYNKECGTIKQIIFNGGEIWNESMRISDVKDHLLRAYKESETNKGRTTKTMLRELRKGRYILSTPKGIDRLKPKEDALRVNNLMPYIRKAWEMKANWKKRKEINAYLKGYGINITTSYQEYFETLIYTGFWMDTEMDKFIPQKFLGGKAPISMELYNRVQLTLKKNTGSNMVSKYGDKQKGDIISELLKWEGDKTKSFSVEFAKGKHPSYKNNAYGGFNKSQNKVLDLYIEQGMPILRNLINKILFLYVLGKGVNNEIFAMKVHEILSNMDKLPDDEKWGYYSTEICNSLESTGVWQEVISNLDTKNAQYINEFSTLLSIYFDEVGRANRIIDTHERDSLIKILRKKKEDKLAERKATPLEYGKRGFPYSVAEDRINEIDMEICSIESDISSLLTSTDMEEFVTRLPEVILKIFELSSKVLTNKEINSFRGDILKLIELTTFELSVSTKKELTVKLFDGFKNVLNPKNKEWLPE